ncbi:hypothetical protein [Akkermansia muciniphila]|uniref:hypothetical protein n=1 Tax=Akkermansia muciniphila TaxID=239935 RepID=UPI00138E6488|nr:hypothetical protein [Akkermansia muciniphila]QHV15419.1 hypothetical protein C5O10_00500 [Akkermansia muciniphila]
MIEYVFFYVVGLSVFSAFLCEGAGIVAWKEQAFHEDSMAKIATYSRRKLSGNKGIFNVKGKDIYLPENLYWYIDIPNGLPLELSDSSQYEMLLKQKYEMGVFRKRFPKSSSILDSWLERLQEYQDNYDSGKRFVNGVWMEKSAYEQQQAAQREKRNQRRLQEEQKRKEADKNTVGTGSRSAGREEKSRISYADGSLKEIGDGSVEGPGQSSNDWSRVKSPWIPQGGIRRSSSFNPSNGFLPRSPLTKRPCSSKPEPRPKRNNMNARRRIT